MRFKEKKDKDKRKKQAYEFYIGKGLTPAQSSALVGNFAVESGFDTRIEGDKNLDHASVGLAQWRGDRLKRLKSKYEDPYNFQNQLDFTWWELNNTHKHALRALKEAETPQDAAIAVRSKFEVAIPDHDDRRIKETLGVLNKYYTPPTQDTTTSTTYQQEPRPEQVVDNTQVVTPTATEKVINLYTSPNVNTFVDETEVIAQPTTVTTPEVKEKPKTKTETKTEQAKQQIEKKKAEGKFINDLLSGRLQPQPQQQQSEVARQPVPYGGFILNKAKELGIFQKGGKAVKGRQGVRKNEDGTVSTHLMTYSESDGVYEVYPTLFQNSDGKWIELPNDKWQAYEEAKKREEVYTFDSEQKAKEFAEGSWKKSGDIGSGIPKYPDGGEAPTNANVINLASKDFVSSWLNDPVTRARLSENLRSYADAQALTNSGLANIAYTRTSQFGEGTGSDRAEYNAGNVSIYGTPNMRDLVHEYTHASGIDRPLTNLINERYGNPLQALRQNQGATNTREAIARQFGIDDSTTFGKDKVSKQIEHASYIGRDGEIYPRIMEAREFLNLTPGQEVDDETINRLYEAKNNDLINYYSKDQLKEILNTIASTGNSSNSRQQYAQRGAIVENTAVNQPVIQALPQLGGTLSEYLALAELGVIEGAPDVSNIPAPVQKRALDNITVDQRAVLQPPQLVQELSEDQKRSIIEEGLIDLNTITKESIDNLSKSGKKVLQRKLIREGALKEKIDLPKSKEGVEEIQQFLIDKGYDLGSYGADGVAGKLTKKAVEQYNKNASSIDGIIGENTLSAFEEYKSTLKEIEPIIQAIEKDPMIRQASLAGKALNQVPISVRQFVYDTFGGEEDITEADLNEGEYNALKEAVKYSLENDVKKNGVNVINYDVWRKVGAGGDDVRQDDMNILNPFSSLQKTLGQARIDIDEEGNIYVIDRYNFNDAGDKNNRNKNTLTTTSGLLPLAEASSTSNMMYRLARNFKTLTGRSEGGSKSVIYAGNVRDYNM